MMVSTRQTFRGQYGKVACMRCTVQKICLGCSWLGWQQFRKFEQEYLLERKAVDKPSEAMVQGSQRHERLQKEFGARNYNTDSEYVWRKLRNERFARFAEGHPCSIREALNGHPDVMDVTIKKKPERLYFHLYEFKSSFNPSQWLQLVGYALIVSDPMMFLGEEPFREKLGLQNPRVYVTATLVPYISNSDYMKYAMEAVIVKDGVFLDDRRFSVRDRRNKYRELMDPRRRSESLPFCQACTVEKPNSYCRFVEGCLNNPVTKQLTLYKSCGLRVKRK